MLVSFLAYSSTLKMEAACSSEKSVDFQRITRRYNTEERIQLYSDMLQVPIAHDDLLMEIISRSAPSCKLICIWNAKLQCAKNWLDIKQRVQHKGIDGRRQRNRAWDTDLCPVDPFTLTGSINRAPLAKDGQKLHNHRVLV
jgi:hypothetical protein